MRRELWRIEDVMTGLSSTKETFKITIDSVKNPGKVNKHRRHKQRCRSREIDLNIHEI